MPKLDYEMFSSKKKVQNNTKDRRVSQFSATKQ